MTQTTFAPLLYIPHGIKDISFYEKAFGAIEHKRFTNDDGSIHVSELSIDGAIFHLHEEKTTHGQFAPETCKGFTSLAGLFVENVDLMMNRAVNAGAIVISPAQDYDYGYRQGEISDPFGHHWVMQKKI